MTMTVSKDSTILSSPAINALLRQQCIEIERLMRTHWVKSLNDENYITQKRHQDRCHDQVGPHVYFVRYSIKAL